MMRCTPWWVLSLSLALLVCGCSPISRNSLEEEKDPHYIEGNKRLNALDNEGAIREFERALQTNPNNSAAHFRLGILYEKSNDLPACIYHYSRFLKLNPASSMASIVKEHLLAAKRNMASAISYTNIPRDTQQQLESYALTNALYLKHIARLEAELNRRPAYITNYVTNFVTVPQFDPKDRSAAHMTESTEIVRSSHSQPEQSAVEPEPEPEREERPRPTPRATQTASSERNASSRTVARNNARERQPEPERERERKREPEKPAVRTHIVRPGETLRVLARKYGVSLSKLTAANPGSSKGVRAGQKIVIP